jgi:cytochrome c peroxidase
VLSSLLVMAGAVVAAAPAAYEWNLPRGFPVPAVPADNPMSVAKVELGRRLFNEPRLSVTGFYSCASCHEPGRRAFSDGRPVAVGATGQLLPRSAMALINVAYNISYGWANPALQSLEMQMREPLFNEHPVELGLSGREEQVWLELGRDEEYAKAFGAVFAGKITVENTIKAIAAYERTLLSGRSAFDRYVFGAEHDAITEQAKRGMALFYSPRAGCGACHSGFNFSGNWRDAQGETGKASFANNGTGAVMRVPTLRNIAVTAPYMHDGRFGSLEAVLGHYAEVGRGLRAGVPLPGAGTGADDVSRASVARLRTFDLSAEERVELIAFLHTLTDEEFLNRYAGR